MLTLKLHASSSWLLPQLNRAVPAAGSLARCIMLNLQRLSPELLLDFSLMPMSCSKQWLIFDVHLNAVVWAA